MINIIANQEQQEQQEIVNIRVDIRFKGYPEEFWNIINSGEQSENPFVQGIKIPEWTYMPADAQPGKRRAGARANIEIVETEHGPMINAIVTPIDNAVISRSYHSQIVKFEAEDYERVRNLLLQFYNDAKVTQAINNDHRIVYYYV